MSKWLIIAAALVAFASAWYVQEQRYQRILSDMQSEHADASRKAVEQELENERAWYASAEAISKQGAQELEQNAIDDTAAGDTADRLREELDAVRRRAFLSDAAAATRSATDRQTILVLTDLYQGADERARELARIFEDARTRGLACEQIYDRIRGLE